MRLTSPLARSMGTFLCRVVVPLWVLSGAAFKLIESTPRLLPQNIFNLLVRQAGVHPHGLLATLIALELFAVAVMLFVGRLARAMAMFMLGVFVLILLGEIAAGHLNCGCFGSKSPPIWLMLAIDGTLLLGAIFLGPDPGFEAAPAGRPPRARWPLAAAAAFTVLGAATSFLVVLRAAQPIEQPPTGGGTGGPGVSTITPVSFDYCEHAPGTTANPQPRLPGSWYTPSDVKVWQGRRWCELDIFQFMNTWPRDIDGRLRYVIFYRRTCDHCEEMFGLDLGTDEGLAAQVTAVEVPESKTELRDETRAWEMPETACELLALPVGCDYILTTPLVFRIENGIVTCVQEGDHAECLDVIAE